GARGSERPAKAKRRARLALLSVYVVGFFLVLWVPPDTRPWKDWKRGAGGAPAPAAAVFPPVPFHPFNRGEGNVPGFEARHWIGVDASNQDVLTRLLFGIR